MPNPKRSLLERIRDAWNSSGPPETQWIVDAAADEVIVIDDVDRGLTRIPVTADGDAISFGEPQKVRTAYVPDVEPVAASRLVFASRAESRPDVAAAAVSDKPWSQFSDSDYSPEQWAKACLIDTKQGAPFMKGRFKLPVLEPDGTLNRNAVHAAAGGHGISAVKGVDADTKQAAAKKLVSLYRNQLGEDPPESLTRMAGMKMAASAPQAPAAEPDQPTTEEDDVSTLSTDVRQRLGLADDVDDAGILTALDTLKTKAETPPAPVLDEAAVAAAAKAEQDAKDAEQKVAAAAAENATLTERLTALDTKVTLLTEQLTSASNELAATRAEKAATLKQTVLASARRDGKYAPADEKVWADRYDKNPEIVTEVLASIPVGTAVPVTVTGETGPAEPTGQDDAEFDRMFSTPAKGV